MARTLQLLAHSLINHSVGGGGGVSGVEIASEGFAKIISLNEIFAKKKNLLLAKHSLKCLERFFSLFNVQYRMTYSFLLQLCLLLVFCCFNLEEFAFLSFISRRVRT